jgi:hypothetical protein
MSWMFSFPAISIPFELQYTNTDAITQFTGAQFHTNGKRDMAATKVETIHGNLYWEYSPTTR